MLVVLALDILLRAVVKVSKQVAFRFGRLHSLVNERIEIA